MGLYIPKSPFNPRLSRSLEKQYLPDITTNLYIQQKQNLPSLVRILQDNLYLEGGGVTLDHYINIIYKDIYARYLLSKGIGIDWEGYYAKSGAVNEKDTDQYLQEAKIQ